MKNSFILVRITCTLLMMPWCTTGICQTDTAILDNMSLTELLNVKIVSVSKTSELLFDAPLSASVITREEIRRTGCTSIMEAMRLIPGMIVREQSNGNYDIHLRGMDNVPPNAAFDITSNTTTLVMIDNRPIYSYLKGGTFWETLPIDLNDVQKIEIIRGPAAALYGPNAVNGVINILTRQPVSKGLYATANSHTGSLNIFINNASIGYRSQKWSAIASANNQARDRSEISYFEFYRNRDLTDPEYMISFNGDTVTNIDVRYPAPARAMRKFGSNIFLNYDPLSKLKFTLSSGVQQSTVQKVSTENALTALSTAESFSHYIDFTAKAGKLSAQVSYNHGRQNTDLDPGNKYHFNTIGVNIEYNYLVGRLSLKPGLNYGRAIYDDTKYSDMLAKTGIFNARGNITTRSASLRAEYKMINNKLRLVAGVAASKFNYPDATYMSYELAATYKVNKNTLFRAVYSRAPRSSTVFDTYVDQKVAFFPTGFKKFTRLQLQGNKNLKLLTADMLELGYRCSISRVLSVDVELFGIYAKNYNSLINTLPYLELSGTDTILVRPVKSTNLPLRLYQQGLTVSFVYNTQKLQVNPFITLQHTNAKNYAPSNNAPDAGLPGALVKNIYSALGTEMQLKSTPAVFGGAQVNYPATDKLNINVSIYYYSSQTYQHLSNLFFNDGIRGIDYIPAKLIFNSSVSYEAAKGLHIFLTGKNLLNKKSREFFHTDVVPAMLLARVNYEL